MGPRNPGTWTPHPPQPTREPRALDPPTPAQANRTEYKRVQPRSLPPPRISIHRTVVIKVMT